MSKLLIVHDFSPGSACLFAALAQQGPLLKENGIEIAPYNPFLSEKVRSHVSLWVPRPENAALPAHIRAIWDTVAETLDACKNVLLFSRRPELKSHRYFWSHAPQWLHLDRHESELLFIYGRPSLLLEQYFRGNPQAGASPFTQKYIGWLHDMAKIAPLVHGLWSDAHMEYAHTATESATSAFDPGLFDRVLNFLGCPVPPGGPGHVRGTGFNSHQSRKLFEALEVRYNAWPPVAPYAPGEVLRDLDRELPEDWLAPLALRQEFARNEGRLVAALESMCGAKAGALAAPPAFLTAPETDAASTFSPQLARAFVAALPPAGREALTARLVNDRPLLDADQQRLLAELSPPQEFSDIGDAEPPVELTVLTMAYNHEKFIGQCIESVLAQKTDFPVRHLVLDHCSDDGTAAIIADYARKYPTVRPVLLSRREPHENVTGLFQRCRSKYAALCDGDDYFTEPTKLQKQVDMLERRPDLAISFHPVAAVFDDGRPPVIFPPLSNLPARAKHNRDLYLADLMNGNFIQTNSVVYRWRFRDGLPGWFRPDLCPGDYYWHMLHAETGKIGFIPEVMSVYRRHAGALYAKAFVSSKELRRDQGLAELEAYSAYNEHFQNRYFRPLSRLATGVFADFMQMSLDENDDRLFNEALKKYPKFGQAFLKALQQLNQNGESLPRHAGGRSQPGS